MSASLAPEKKLGSELYLLYRMEYDDRLPLDVCERIAKIILREYGTPEPPEG